LILVTGATGHIGRHLVQQLMALDHRVRVLLSPDQLGRLPWDTDDPNAPDIVVGTLLEDEVLFQAVSNVHVIYHLENAMWWGRLRDLERVEIVGTRNLIAAARSARVGRIITLSHLGAAPSSAFTLLRIKGQFEALIRNSGLAYTIIRPGIIFGPEDSFVNNLAMLFSINPFFYLMPGYGEIVLHPLYIDDLIEALVRSLDLLRVVDQTIDLGGPEYTTFADLVQTVMRVTGMYRYIIPVAPYIIRILIRLYSIPLRRTLITAQWLDYLAAGRTAPLGTAFNVFGFYPRRFEDTLLTYLPEKRHLGRALRYALRGRPRGI
jgi:uncharacterized protein YbjT (DUF2867 family)